MFIYTNANKENEIVFWTHYKGAVIHVPGVLYVLAYGFRRLTHIYLEAARTFGCFCDLLSTGPEFSDSAQKHH